jgi:hypothetical protein
MEEKAESTDFLNVRNEGAVSNDREVTTCSDEDDEWETLDLVPNEPMDHHGDAKWESEPVAQIVPPSPPPRQSSGVGLIRRRLTPNSQASTTMIPHHRNTSSQPVPTMASEGNRPNSATTRGAPTRQSTSSIVSHPMRHIAAHFVLHLWRETWATDATFRLSLACFVMGAVAQCAEWTFYYILYPEQLLWTLTILLGAGVPAFLHYKPRIERLVQHLQQASEFELGDILGRCVDTAQVRIFLGVWWFVVPALLELRTLQFLTNIIGRSLLAALAHVIFVGGRCCHDVTLAYTADPSLRGRIQLLASRQYTQFGLYCLYGSALFLTLCYGAPKKHIPSLAARFLLSTGVILYQSSTTDPSQVVRRALRFTVRDALQHMGTCVQQDELLQLTMLRWIVDYWSSSSSTASSTAQQASKQSSNTANTAPRPASEQKIIPTNKANASSSLQRRLRPSEVLQFRQPELNWTDLCPMLQTTTNQITSEVDSLQHHSETTARSSVRDGGKPNRRTQTSNATQASRDSDPTFDGSVQSLQAMLSSMNLDEQAKPTVLAYKEIVNTFPPTSFVAVALGLFRRVPAIVLLVSTIMLGVLGFHHRPLAVVISLLPFALLEAVRVMLWAEACHIFDESNSGNQRADPMTILLLDDRYHATEQLPTLLVVWRNVHASAGALEVSLTTARCVQTTVVAADFAANVLSLANFGMEVSRHGWFHGISIVAMERLHLQSSRTDPRTLWHGVSAPTGASYTSAAVSAVRNSQTISRNLQALSSEGVSHNVVGQTLGFLALLVGHGWVWGRDHEEVSPSQNAPLPSIQIVEVEESETTIEAPDENEMDAERKNSSVGEECVNVSFSVAGTSESIINPAPAPDSSIPTATLLSSGLETSLQVGPGKSTVGTIGAAEAMHVACVPESKICGELDLDVDNLQLGRKGEGALSVSSEESLLERDTDIGERLNGRRNRDSIGGSWDESDERAPTTGMDEEIDCQVRRDQAVESVAVALDGDEVDADDNLWLKVGGGLAVLGAVVAGSVALLATQHGKEHDRKDNKDKKSG